MPIKHNLLVVFWHKSHKFPLTGKVPQCAHMLSLDYLTSKEECLR